SLPRRQGPAWYDDEMYKRPTYRRSSIPNEASLTAREILELATRQYHAQKRKLNPAAEALSGPNGHGTIKTSKAPPGRRAVARKAKKS
ncbi:MAG TPA: hypothetical protein VML36_00840, partial [Nitrospiria bacterium]|nr:hypothetical protein [Nitrospiria bacterium]